MNRTTHRRTLYGSTVALALFFILVLPADADAIGLYSVIARAAEADIQLVILIPEENTCAESDGVNNRIRFTCNVYYRHPGNATWGRIERRGLIVTDRFIGLVTVTGTNTDEVSMKTPSTRDTSHPLKALHRTVNDKVKSRIATSVCCLKAIVVAARHLIEKYAL
jgi:hypothetical protein